MSREALRALFYAIGATLVAVGGFDDTLVAAGIPALGIISAGLAKVLMAAGALSIGYAKQAKALGDFSLKDASDALQEVLAAPETPARDTSPGIGPTK